MEDDGGIGMVFSPGCPCLLKMFRLLGLNTHTVTHMKRFYRHVCPFAGAD